MEKKKKGNSLVIICGFFPSDIVAHNFVLSKKMTSIEFLALLSLDQLVGVNERQIMKFHKNWSGLKILK